jgi:hypothetical protein
MGYKRQHLVGMPAWGERGITCIVVEPSKGTVGRSDQRWAVCFTTASGAPHYDLIVLTFGVTSYAFIFLVVLSNFQVVL